MKPQRPSGQASFTGPGFEAHSDPTLPVSASTQVALRAVAGRLVAALQVAFCQIALLDESGQHLVVAASARAWKGARASDVGQRLAIENVPYMGAVVRSHQPLLASVDVLDTRAALDELRLVAGEQVQSAILMPLTDGSRARGLVALGERRAWARAAITPAKMSLARVAVEEVRLALPSDRRPAEATTAETGKGTAEEAGREEGYWAPEGEPDWAATADLHLLLIAMRTGVLAVARAGGQDVDLLERLLGECLRLTEAIQDALIGLRRESES